MKKIGITGSIATGKSVASKFFESLGHLVISADIINEELLKEKEVIKEINKLLFKEDAIILNKKRVAELIFNEQEAKLKLESYLHPLIYEEIKKIINNSKEELIFIEVPLLYETNFINLVDYVLVIYADEEAQIKRIVKRDSISELEAIKRIKGQMPLKEKLLKADYVINNSNTLKETKQELYDWYLNYTRRL